MGLIYNTNRSGYISNTSIYTNLDFLFWRIPKEVTQELTVNPFPWILWFIWKARNTKFFKGIDRKPPDILKHALGEAYAWEHAQVTEDVSPDPLFRRQGGPESSHDVICQVDGSWKKDSRFTGLGWYLSNPAGLSIRMGAKGQRRSLSPLHAELEALIWAMECMVVQQELVISFQTDCAELVTMATDPAGWPSFCVLLSTFVRLRQQFRSFSLSHISRTLNGKADCLACSATSRESEFVYVNNVPPVWLTKPFS